ncbi:MXAN_6230/SCO0854 family RING domain-containing protein [Nonomuraea sp. NPDC050153]|uniref:MXAN_6230/SCO0854 family RING domain-containing protein n=1 Tax=Nonomuraea sp. NPDC050153 TaxID=3364359 RepID=UPI0037988990
MNRSGEVLLRRRRLVALGPLTADARVPPPVGKLPRRLGMVRANVTSGVAALEFELLQLGFLVSGELYRALAGLSAEELTKAGRRLLHCLRDELGANDSHIPLFRKFPESVPSDTSAFYVRRVFSLLLQDPARPCVLCGEAGTVRPVSPCAHLVCRTCWDGSDFSACPICHRRIDLDDPFLQPSEQQVSAHRDTVTTTTLLRLCGDPAAECRELATTLLARRTPMQPPERADLRTLLDDNWPAAASWLPDAIPVKETRAAVVAYGLRRGADELLPRHADTATDVLRVLYALMDADPGLRVPPLRRGSLPRRVRRAVLGCLDAMPYLLEDLLRYREQWKHLAEVLHPHEQHARFPRAAVAFAAVRGTRLDPGTPFGRALLDGAARHPDVEVRDGRVRVATFAGRVEAALADGRHADACALLAQRPGELLRRLCHLLRHGPVPLDVLEDAARRVAPGVLLAALGQVRTPPGGVRMFLPRGGTSRFWTLRDDRPPLADDVVLEVEHVLTAELLRRAGELPPLRRVLLDEAAADLIAPTSERSSSAALVRLARGSVQPIPRAEKLRFFLHWAEPPGTRVDLDLSVAVFDEGWRFAGLCDYTRLRLGKGLVHSGDLTSAPVPLGASEFIDVDVRALPARYLVPVVFSFNAVPFEELVRGYAGFMERPSGQFDPVAVRQRFDLSGPAKILVPLVADLWTRTMRWADLNLSAAGYGNNVARNADELAALGAALESAFEHRVTLWEIGCWHAAARAGDVVVRRRDDSLVRYERRPGEDAEEFAARLVARADAPPLEGPPDGTDLAVLVSGDVELPGARAYALHPYALGEARLLDAADLLSGLSPAMPANVLLEPSELRSP